MKGWISGHFCDCPGSDQGLRQDCTVPLAVAEKGYLQKMKGMTGTHISLQ